MLKHFLKNAVQANLDLRKPVFSFLNSDLRNFYYWIWKSVVRKKCLMLVNFQVEIFLKSRFHCNRILARSFFKIRIDNNDKSNVLIAFNIPFSSRLNQDLTQTKSFSLPTCIKEQISICEIFRVLYIKSTYLKTNH